MSSKTKFIITVSYILSSGWGLFTLYDLIINPYDIIGLSSLAIFNIVMSVAVVMFLPLGIVFSVDRYLRNKENKLKHAV
jgi:hypothetical protein